MNNILIPINCKIGAIERDETMGLIAEFKEFALKGNVVDLAVGVIVGAAFGAIVKSVVDDVIMPPLGWLMGGLDFSDKIIVIQHAGSKHLITGALLTKDVVISYGKFINSSIQFLIQAMAIFILIKLINQAKRKPQPAPDQPSPLTKDQELLAEIRDAIRAKT